MEPDNVKFIPKFASRGWFSVILFKFFDIYTFFLEILQSV